MSDPAKNLDTSNSMNIKDNINNFTKKLETELLDMNLNKCLSNSNLSIINDDIINKSQTVKTNSFLLYILIFLILNHDKTIQLLQFNLSYSNNINLIIRTIIFALIIYIIK